MLAEFIFGIWVKMIQLTWWMILTWLIKGVFYKKNFIICKNEWEYLFNLLSKNRDVILNRAKDYYENDKEKLWEQARDKYRNLSEEEKNKREYGKNRYLNMSEEKKKRSKESQKKKYREAKKISI